MNKALLSFTNKTACSFLRSVLFFSVYLFCFNGYGQSADQSEIYYNEAVNAFRKTNYKKADSLYTLSLRLQPHPDTYFNRAMSRLKLNNKTGYYEDLICATTLGDEESAKMLKTNCISIDTLKYLTQVVMLEDSILHNYYNVIYAFNDMDSKFECKFEGKSFLLNISWFRESPVDTTIKESPAEYRGGLAAMSKFISWNMRYPKKAREEGIGGKVFLKFVIGPTGCIERVTLLTGIKDCPECDAEAVRLILSMPRWKSAHLYGKAVKTYFTLPLVFKIR